VPIYLYYTLTGYKLFPYCWNSVTVDCVLSIVKLSIKYEEQLPTVLCKTMNVTINLLAFSGKVQTRKDHEGPEVE
jgi:hypothetical protein